MGKKERLKYAQRIIPCFTDKTFSELKRTLSYPKFELQLLKNRIIPEAIIRLISSRAHFTPETRQIREIKDDMSDNNILACALSARVSFIVSGDRHLLVLKSFGGIPIVTPKEFITLIHER